MKHLPLRLLFLLTLVSANLYAIDSDRDTLPDDWELANGRDPNVADYQINAGWETSCAIDDTGVQCWGGDRFAPTGLPRLSNPVQISAGRNHTCSLDDNGVQCWGDNNHGQTDVPALSNPLQVSAGGNHTCALDDNGVQCWGDNTFGQIDVRSNPAIDVLSNPVQVTAGHGHTCAIDDNGVQCWGDPGEGQTDVPPLSNPVQVSAGYGHTCAIDDNGVQCWGLNSVGQSDVPTLSNSVQVSAGGNHTCALDDNGVQCWGGNLNGATDVPALSNPVQVNAAFEHTCALDDNGVQCWGDNEFGQTDVPALSNPVQIGAGGNFWHSCALDDNGVQCWGDNTSGQSDAIFVLSNPVRQVSAGHYWHSCALDDNRVQCWGYNNHGQANVPFLSNPLQVSAGSYHTCALDDNGVQCWGYNNHGEIDVPALSNPLQVSAGRVHTCALDDNGVQCWGDNLYGQIDAIVDLSNPVQVSAGGNHTCVLDDNGVQCWGLNSVGQSDVPTLSNSVQVSAGRYHSCALDDNGVHCWGDNDDGQTDVPPLSNPVQVSAGSYHTCALDENGVQCWGGNLNGATDVPSLRIDPDADGVSNQGNLDAFPFDPAAAIDSDGDGKPDEWNPGKSAVDSTSNPPLTLDDLVDDDGDGIANDEDAFPLDASEWADSDGDGFGNNSDVFPLDGTEWLDTDGDGIGDNSDVYPENAIVRGSQFLQTTSASANITKLHVLNTSDREQSFRALMYDGNGDRVGGVPLIGDPVPPMGRIVLTSEDIEELFDTEPWQGPAMLEVRGESTFDVMSKLISPSGLVSNTNCVREDRVLNIEGFDSSNMSYIRVIYNRNGYDAVIGTLYDANGNVVGNADSVLVPVLHPYQQVWLNRDDLADLVGAQWNGEALLEVKQFTGLKLLNLNYITDEKTFFNFSCFEDSTSGRVYLQTTSTSQNVSATHLVNTSDVEQQLTGTLYGSDGTQVGLANQPLHTGTIPSKGRIIISSEDIESAFNISPWSGPAMLEVSGTDSFELMTKLTSPSGLISNTNCVRQDQVHNIGGFDQTDVTYVRFINVGDTPINNIRGSLYDTAGNVVGETNPVLIDELPAKAHVWRNRNQLSDLIGDTWNGTASLKIDNADSNLRLLNLNFINSETFFNFSCYETGQ